MSDAIDLDAIESFYHGVLFSPLAVGHGEAFTQREQIAQHALAHVPALVARVRELESERDEARSQCASALGYIDAAKLAAQRHGRVCGEPLNEWIESFAKGRDNLRELASDLIELNRRIEWDDGGDRAKRLLDRAVALGVLPEEGT